MYNDLISKDYKVYVGKTKKGEMTNEKTDQISGTWLGYEPFFVL